MKEYVKKKKRKKEREKLNKEKSWRETSSNLIKMAKSVTITRLWYAYIQSQKRERERESLNHGGGYN